MASQAFLWGGVNSKTQAGAGTGTSDTFSSHLEVCVAAIFVLNVTAAAAAGGDTLDVWVQHSWDEGTTWDDFIHFTQVLGSGGALVHVAQWVIEGGTPTNQLHKAATKTLAVGVNQGPIGAQQRVQYTTATAGTANFTFAVVVEGIDQS
jgi:hypothetical protein